MRNLIKLFLHGVVSVVAFLTGMSLFQWIYDKLTNPVERVKLKKKLIKVKNAITEKD